MAEVCCRRRQAANRQLITTGRHDVIAASIFDHPAILLLIAFITLVRWLISKAKAQTQDNTQTETPTPMPPARPISRGGETQTEEERIRRFLEALGQPPGTTPPKVTPRRA